MYRGGVAISDSLYRYDPATKELTIDGSAINGLIITIIAEAKSGRISQILITDVKTPVLGQPCSVSGTSIKTVPEKALITTGEKAAKLYWRDETDSEWKAETDVFEAGHLYRLVAGVNFNEGYYMDGTEELFDDEEED